MAQETAQRKVYTKGQLERLFNLTLLIIIRIIVIWDINFMFLLWSTSSMISLPSLGSRSISRLSEVDCPVDPKTHCCCRGVLHSVFRGANFVVCEDRTYYCAVLHLSACKTLTRIGTDNVTDFFYCDSKK